MAGMTDALEDEILAGIFGGNVDIALYTVSPTDTGGGTEVTGGSYARVTVPNTAWSTPAGSGSINNANASITFQTPTASWGEIVAFGIFVSSTLKLYGAVSPAVDVVLGDNPVRFKAGDLVVTLDN